MRFLLDGVQILNSLCMKDSGTANIPMSTTAVFWTETVFSGMKNMEVGCCVMGSNALQHREEQAIWRT